jgi:hypothetical protein
MAARLNIGKIWKLTNIKEGTSSYLVIDKANPDNQFPHLCKQYCITRFNNEFSVWPYVIQGPDGIPLHELFVQGKAISSIYSTLPEFKVVLDAIENSGMFEEVLFRGASLDIYRQKQ